MSNLIYPTKGISKKLFDILYYILSDKELALGYLGNFEMLFEEEKEKLRKQLITQLKRGKEPEVINSKIQKDILHLADIELEQKLSVITKGITKKQLVNFKERINLSYDEISYLLGITTRSIHLKKNDDYFKSSISEKLLALIQLFKYGFESFEDDKKFIFWLKRPMSKLNDGCYFDILNTYLGIEEVRNQIKTLVENSEIRHYQ